MASKLAKAWAILRDWGFSALMYKLREGQRHSNYQEWINKYDTLSDADRNEIGREIESFSIKPLISVLMPTKNSDVKWLRCAIESVRAQLYSNWELCIADDASTSVAVRALLEEYKSKDSRIRVIYCEKAGGIANASNAALSMASGRFVALLDHDDELSEKALFAVCKEINASPHSKLIYSDEDKKLKDGTRLQPYFKPDWNPDLLRAQNYICHLLVLEKDIVCQVGAFRSECDGAQDWDLVLRICERLSRAQIRHISQVLYHWRMVEGSTAQSLGFKSYVLKAQMLAVREHLQRIGTQDAIVESEPALSHLRVRWPLAKPEPLLSVIVNLKSDAAPSIQVERLKRLLLSLNRRNIELFLVQREDAISSSAKTVLPRHTIDALLEKVFGKEKMPSLSYLVYSCSDKELHQGAGPLKPQESTASLSQCLNQAARQAKGEVLLFLDGKLSPRSAECFSEMLSQVGRNDVGAVGAKVVSADGRIVQAGLVLGIAQCWGASHAGRPRADLGYFNRTSLVVDCAALSEECVMLRKSVFTECEGLDESLAIGSAFVDLCLKLRQRGLLIVFDPIAEFVQPGEYKTDSSDSESPTQIVCREADKKRLHTKWGNALLNDPYYNPNLSLQSTDYALAFPPRVNLKG